MSGPQNNWDPFNFVRGMDKGYRCLMNFNIFINSYI